MTAKQSVAVASPKSTLIVIQYRHNIVTGKLIQKPLVISMVIQDGYITPSYRRSGNVYPVAQLISLRRKDS